jgi:hypothetical protein
VDLPIDSGWTHHIDFLSSGSEEDNFLYMKYYADEEDRQYAREHYPDEVIPPHEDPPYHRDANLPKAQEP